MIHIFRTKSRAKSNRRPSIISSRLGFEPLEDRRLLSVQEWSFKTNIDMSPQGGGTSVSLEILYAVDTEATPVDTFSNSNTTSAIYRPTIHSAILRGAALTPTGRYLSLGIVNATVAGGHDAFYLNFEVTGKLSGIQVTGVDFGFEDPDGTMFDSTKLPLTSDFTDLAEQGWAAIEGPGYENGFVSPRVLTLFGEKPDIKVANIEWRDAEAGGGLEFAYSIIAEDLPQLASVSFFWADSPTATTGTPATAVRSTATAKGNYTITVPGSSLSTPPNSNGYLVAVVDQFGVIPEISEENNRGVLALNKPDAKATNLQFQSLEKGGGIVFSYTIRGGNLPQAANVSFVWADSPTATGGTRAAPDRTTATIARNAAYTLTVGGADFTEPPAFNSYLVAFIDSAAAIVESSETNNRTSVGDLVGRSAVHVEWDVKAIGPTSLSVREVAKNDTYQVLLKVENLSPIPIPSFSQKWVEFRSQGVSGELPPSSTKHFGSVAIPPLLFGATSSVALGAPTPDIFRHNWEWIEAENPVFKDYVSQVDSEAFVMTVFQELKKVSFVELAGKIQGAFNIIDSALATDRINTFQYDLTPDGPGPRLVDSTPSKELVIGVPVVRLASFGAHLVLAAEGAEHLLEGLGKLILRRPDSAVTLLAAAAELVGAAQAYEFAKDPADPNFRELVTLQPLTLPVADPPLTGVAAEAAKIQLQIAALRIAQLKARNKADGAELAGDATWFSAQLASAADFSNQIALLHTRLIAYESQLETIVASEPPANPADVRQYLEAQGLPEMVRSIFAQSGWTAQEIAGSTAALVSLAALPVRGVISQVELNQLTGLFGSFLAQDQLTHSQQLKREQLGATVRPLTSAEIASLNASETSIEQRLKDGVPAISLLAAIEAHLTTVRRLAIETNDPAVEPRLDLAIGYSAQFQLLDPTVAGIEAYIGSQKTAGKISTQSASSLLAQVAVVRTALQAGNYPQSAAALQTLLNLVNSQGTGIATTTADQLRTFIDYLSHSVTGTIFAPNQIAVSPVAANDTATTNKNTAISINVLTNDSDPDGSIDPKTVTIVAAPGHGIASVNATTGAITYTPASNYTGADSFTYKVKDNSGAFSNVATVSITVQALANKPPVANNDTATTNKNTPVAINVLANDSDADGNVNATTVAIIAAPTHGTTSVNPTTGAITYTPASNYTGPDSFTYKVKDNRGAYSNLATVSITTNTQQNGSISGKEYFDVTGNGLTADDTPLAGVKVYLDTNNNSVWNAGEPTATTLSDGSYSLTGLAAGTYKVRQVAPNGYVRTAPAASDYYSVSLASGQSSGGNNFANAELGNSAVLSNIVYVINGKSVVSDLRGQTKEGDTVQVSFTVAAGAQARRFTLVSYTAPGSAWDPNTASQQKIFDSDTGVFGPGTHTLAVSNPHSYFQVDFVGGHAIDRLGAANSNIFYSSQSRLFSADNGGTRSVRTSPASLTGAVYHDANNNGVFDAGERPIAGTKVTLSGATTQTVFTDIYGTYTFDNLPAGTYGISETQPNDYTDGKDKLGNKGGTLTNDKASGIVLAAGASGTSYVFGEQQTLGSPLAGNQTQTTAWWNGSTGQTLIKALNSGQNSKNLGNWLATNFDNLFGANAGSANNLSGKTNAQVAAYYQSLYANSARRPETETLALALAVYVTNSALAGTTAASPAYGFAVTSSGLANATVSVGGGGAAFGVNNNAIMTVAELLSRANARARKGLLWDADGNGSLTSSETILRERTHSLFGSVNNT